MKPQFPFDESFYSSLTARRRSFQSLKVHEVPAGTGYGFRVKAGEAFRFEMSEGVQILDVCIFNADDPKEHYDAGAQFNIEGSFVTRFTRIWGTPPRSRPLATVLADTVRWLDNPEGFRDHKSYGAHCNPHEWALYSSRPVRTCYDNLRAALAMLGFSQRHIHDNLNLFERMTMDPYTGKHLHARSDARKGDYLEFYAELPLLVAVSLCPMGDGSTPPNFADVQGWRSASVPLYPIRIELLKTGVQPKDWRAV